MISASLPQRIARECQDELEHCGLLLAEFGDPTVNDFVSFPGPLQRERFEIDPSWILAESLRQRQEGRRIAGYFHTHPRGRSVEPSSRDRAGHPPGARVLIVSDELWAFYQVGWDEGDWVRLFSGTLPDNQGFAD